MKGSPEANPSFYADAIYSQDKIAEAVKLSTAKWETHPLSPDFIDVTEVYLKAPIWLIENNFQRLRSVASLGGILFWAKLIREMDYPQERLVKQNLITEVLDTDIDAAHEMRSRAEGFENTPLMFALAAASGRKVKDFIVTNTTHTQSAVSDAAINAGIDFDKEAKDPIGYYERLSSLFPAGEGNKSHSAWQYLLDDNAFSIKGRCPAIGFTKIILDEFGKIVATEEFRDRILSGK